MIASSVACTVASNTAPIRSIRQHRHLTRRPRPLRRLALAVENAMKMSPEPLLDTLPVRAEAERRAARDPLQLMRQQRRIGGDDDDDRAEPRRRRRARTPGRAAARRGRLRQLAGRPATPATRSRSRVPWLRLDQHADREAADSARRSSATTVPVPHLNP